MPDKRLKEQGTESHWHIYMGNFLSHEADWSIVDYFFIYLISKELNGSVSSALTFETGRWD